MKKKSLLYIIATGSLIIALSGCKSSSSSTQTGTTTPTITETTSQIELQGLNREFRGAWIQCVNGQFQGMSTATMQADLIHQLDELKRDGINTIIFQVRAECDALYESPYEPWSRFLTGRQGVAPSPRWDPLAFMVDECHKRGMELHAWINPYRARTKTTKTLASNHIAKTHPERVFAYDGLLILNPGIKENKDYIINVVKDIVNRYDIDGLHIDDYFYPYPAPGQNIPDRTQYLRYGTAFTNIADWRRDNVNRFIKELNTAIHEVKPWVKFGVSPFGIYRNRRVDPDGSNTNGLSNYDDLYADVLLWEREGWLDYIVPQIYWQIGYSVADYETLIKWWDAHTTHRALIIGEDVERTVKYNQLDEKMKLERECGNVKGSCQWYSRVVVNDLGGYATKLRTTYFNTPTLNIAMPWLAKRTPAAPRKLKAFWVDGAQVLFWTPDEGDTWDSIPTEYIIYRNGQYFATTKNTFIQLPHTDGKTKVTYSVTALNRILVESKAANIKVKE